MSTARTLAVVLFLPALTLLGSALGELVVRLTS
jgi:hypothetical protein